jgi:hypothetical protein
MLILSSVSFIGLSGDGGDRDMAEPHGKQAVGEFQLRGFDRLLGSWAWRNGMEPLYKQGPPIARYVPLPCRPRKYSRRLPAVLLKTASYLSAIAPFPAASALTLVP